MGQASDALVFFGASGDLAHKKIFPALYAMVKRGVLDVPVIGVASSSWTVVVVRRYEPFRPPPRVPLRCLTRVL